MPTAYIKEVTASDPSVIIYPVTKSQAVYMSDNTTTVQAAIDDIVNANISVNALGKKIIENYTGSSVAGASQSVKAALDGVNNNLVTLNSRFAGSNISFVNLPGSSGGNKNAIQFTVDSSSDTTEYTYFLIGTSASHKMFVFLAYIRFSAQIVDVLSLGDVDCTGTISENTAIIKVNNWMTGYGISRNQVANISYTSVS